MKPQKEKLLNKAYNIFLQTSLSEFPLEQINELMDQNVMGFGTAVNERINSISDYRKMIKRQRKQGKEIEIHISNTPALRKIVADENFAIYVDEVKILMTVNNESQQLLLRNSTVLEYRDEKWIILHFHRSKPEYFDGENDTWHINELKQKTEELENIITEKTTDLELKNNELKIEASLERIRTVAMSMQKAEGLLDVVEILNTELKTLGFTDIRNTIINIFNDTKEIFLNYDYSDYGVGGISEVDYNSHPSNKKLVEKMREANKDFMITEFTGDELDEWRKWRIDQGQMPDSKLDQAESLYYYEYSIGVGSIGISTFTPINADQLEILNKIRNVFDLAYRRYSDIALAEANAREARIEAGLERVRASAMAMHKSEQLSETAKVLFEEFAILGKIPDRMSIGIIDEENKNVEMWVTDQSGNDLNHEFFFSIEEPTSISKIYAAWKDGKDFALIDLTGQNLKAWLKFVKNVVKLPVDETKIKGRRVHQAAFFSHGFLLLTTHKPISDEIMDLLVRFARVFNQSYTRFLDLVNAEAQAREAQIETALEKVRSRSLAMHTSEELADTATILFEQLETLGELPDRVGICIINEEQKYFEQWVTDQDGKFLGHRINAPIAEPTTMSKLYNAWKEKKDHLTIVLKDLELKKWMKFVREDLKMVVDDTKIKGRRIHNGVFFSNGMFLCTTHEPVSNEVIQLLIRFVKVFEQAYRRFLDLQKAEAQAREAQIEAALERVRSKTMAMHNSNDVGETVATLFDEVLKLGLDKSIRCGIGILEGNEGMETWSATSYPNGEVDLKMGMLDMTIHPMLVGLKKAWQKGEKGYSYVYIGDDLTRYYNSLNNEPEYPFHVDIDKLPEKEFHKSFFFTEGILFSFALNPISEEAANVLNRFASVFGQTYRRYLDLQKAEAQTREAKIEAALEKVRSKAMAMYNSEDLALTIDLFFHELKNLNIKPIRCGVGIKNGDSRIVDITVTSATKNGDDIKLTGKLSLGGHPILDKVYEALQLETEYFPVLRGEKINEYYLSMNPEIEFPNYSKDDVQYGYYFHYKEGGVFAWTEKELLEEEINIFRRFKSVLSLTYRRFLDLKEAEAQNVIIHAENERKTQELEEARELQLSMLPKELPILKNIELAVHMETATEVGGDYYDFHIGEDGTLTAVVGDATGHGMKAGTMVTITKSLFDSLASEENILNSFSRISSIIKGMKFRHLSMCLTMLKIKGNRMIFSSAAMPPIMIYRDETKYIEEINLKGMPLGTFKDFPYQLGELELSSKDVILLMSDGFPELLNSKNEMYGYERTKDLFEELAKESPETIISKLKEEASNWIKNKDLIDDVTFVVVKVK